jgi:hypothetical protein
MNQLDGNSVKTGTNLGQHLKQVKRTFKSYENRFIHGLSAQDL